MQKKIFIRRFCAILLPIAGLIASFFYYSTYLNKGGVEFYFIQTLKPNCTVVQDCVLDVCVDIAEMQATGPYSLKYRDYLEPEFFSRWLFKKHTSCFSAGVILLFIACAFWTLKIPCALVRGFFICLERVFCFAEGVCSVYGAAFLCI